MATRVTSDQELRFPFAPDRLAEYEARKWKTMSLPLPAVDKATAKKILKNQQLIRKKMLKSMNTKLFCLSLLLLLAGCAEPSPAWAEAYHLIPEEEVADAIFLAEGGKRTRHPYGILSVEVSSEAEARQVCLNSIRNSRQRWEKAGRPGDWLEYFAKRWCPVGTSNDPTALNKNWLTNVRYFLDNGVGI